MNYNEAYELLKAKDQLHILRYYDELDNEGKESLLKQISDIDFSILDNLHAKEEKKESTIVPINAMMLEDIEKKHDEYKSAGLKAIKAGDLALVLLAGGQGTRLGFDGPKGTFNVGETKDMFIFQLLVEHTLDVVHESGTWIHFFIMTNVKNHEQTTTFFREHDYFGYNRDYIHFFRQEMVPSTDFDGKILLEDKGQICLSPNGNGGWFSSLERAGLMDTIVKDNIKWINVFSVDNVLQGIADPVFLGAVLKEGYVSGGKVIKKADPHERVGVLCMKDGKPFIVEYYELSEEMAYEKNERGEYAYNYGVTLNYMFPVDKLMNLLDKKMPLHVVKKKVPYINNEGEFVKPEEPNGYKFETLALDMIGYMETCLPFEVVREKEFAPIKNATGVDSIETARALLVKNGYTL